MAFHPIPHPVYYEPQQDIAEAQAVCACWYSSPCIVPGPLYAPGPPVLSCTCTTAAHYAPNMTCGPPLIVGKPEPWYDITSATTYLTSFSKPAGDVQYIAHYVPSGSVPTVPDGFKGDGKYHYNWYGRSAAEVQDDRHRQALDSGVYKSRDLIPQADANDQFWIVEEKTHKSMLCTFEDIQKKWAGSWNIDPRYGSHYFLKTGDKKGDWDWD